MDGTPFRSQVFLSNIVTTYKVVKLHNFFSHKSDSRIANVRLSVICLKSKPLSLSPSLYLSLLLSAPLCLTVIMPISFLIFFRDF